MRGEDALAKGARSTSPGSPPHARGRQLAVFDDEVDARITPACAGKTMGGRAPKRGGPDHPRMRGEDSFADFLTLLTSGSPPHARGRPQPGDHRRGLGRITPACAGKTPTPILSRKTFPDHPRMRGEDLRHRGRRHRKIGSPPHARGRQLDSPGNPAKSSPSLPVFFCS